RQILPRRIDVHALSAPPHFPVARAPWFDACRPLYLSRAGAATDLYTLSLHDALPISPRVVGAPARGPRATIPDPHRPVGVRAPRSEEHTSELQSRGQLVCRLLLEKRNITDAAMAFSEGYT